MAADGDSWVSISSSIATVISVFVAGYAIRQSILQRTVPTKPQLIIKNIDIQFQDTSNTVFPFMFAQELQPDYIEVPITNVGLGTALNISYHWDFDYKSNFEECDFIELKESPMFSKESFNAAIKNKSKGIYYDLNKNNEFQKFDIINNQRVKLFSVSSRYSELEYIIPITQSPEKSFLRLPDLIPLAIISKLFMNDNLNEVMLEKLEFGVLRITYDDISGNTKTLQYSCVAQLVKFQSNSSDKAISTLRLTFHRIHPTPFLKKMLKNLSELTFACWRKFTSLFS